MTASQSALFRHRKALGMTQAQLAHLAHIAQADIVSFEKGGRLPTIGQAKRIALALGLKVEALFTDGFREQSKHTGRPIKSYVPYMPPAPVPHPSSGLRPADSRRLVCPRCGASSYSLCDLPGLAFQCILCGRSFGMDGKMAEPKTPRAVKMSAETKAKMSIGQRARRAGEREMRDE